MDRYKEFEDFFSLKTSKEYALDIAKRMQIRRKAMKLTQEGLSKKSGVSYGSIKRFETKGEIALTSLLKIAIALECEDDFETLLQRKHYNSIQEVIDEANVLSTSSKRQKR